MSDEIQQEHSTPPDVWEILRGVELPEFKTILELGAADGEDSPKIAEALKFKDGLYYALEPEPINLTVIKGKPFFQSHNRHVLPLAIGDETRRAIFHQSRGTTQSGSIKTPVRHLDVYPWCQFETTIVVPLVRLDDLSNLLGIDTVDFIWADIQGAEDLLIKGGQQTLAKTRYLYTEYSDIRLYSNQLNAEEILAALPGEWSFVQKWPNDVLMRNDSGFKP